MEPFGLFQILQSFLGQNPASPPQTEETSEPESIEKAEETAPPPPAKPETEDASTNQAFLSFMQAHETRAKRIKKL